jgi:ribonuclease HI
MKKKIAAQNSINSINPKEIFKDYHLKQAEYKKAINKSKSLAWKKLIQDDLKDTTAVAKLQKLMSKNHSNRIGTLLKDDNTYTKSEKESLQVLAATHFPGNIRPKINDVHCDQDENLLSIDLNRSLNLFNLSSIEWAIDSFQSFKSPGPDGIFPALLQKSKHLILIHLQTFMVKSHAWGYIPNAWRQAKVSFIPKAGKICGTAKAYRPITLSSFALKAQERIIDRHIRDNILKSYPLHNLQFAYQPGKSTVCALQALKKRIQKNFEQKEFALGAFLDIAGAFDNTTFESITSALISKKVDSLTSNWITSMLSSRTISTTIGSSEIAFSATRGCPQGGVLSPLLWSLVVDDLLIKLNKLGFYAQGYADDIVILIKGPFSSTVSEKMQIALNSVARWCRLKNLTINPSKTELILFTKNKKLKGQLLQLKLFGETLSYQKEVKYLGVIFDCKLNWTSHLNKVLDKATKLLFTCKSMVGKLWGLKPTFVHWIYTAIVRPIISYAAIVWWNKTLQESARKKLKKLQHLACLLILGCSNTSPTAAIEVLLDLAPLHIHLTFEAFCTSSRFKLSELPEIATLSEDHFNKISAKYGINCELTDMMLKKYIFNKYYQVSFPNRDEWHSKHIVEDAIESWYTDGSKTDLGVGCGIYSEFSNTQLSIPMGNSSTVFLAEVLAINECASLILQKHTTNKTIHVNSDSQAALMALNKCIFDSKLVFETAKKLNDIGKRNKLLLRWIPAHSGFKGNENADSLAKLGANSKFIGPEPFIGVPWCILKSCMHKWLFDERDRFFWSTPGLDHAKAFFKGLNTARAKQILSLSRTDCRLVTGFLVGHFPTRSRLFKMKILDDDLCRFCEEEAETCRHILCECVALERLRIRLFKLQNPTPDFFSTININRLTKYLRTLSL